MACAHSPDIALTEIHRFQSLEIRSRFDVKHLTRQLTAAHTAQKSCRLKMGGVERRLKVFDGKADDLTLVMIEVFACLTRVPCPDSLDTQHPGTTRFVRASIGQAPGRHGHSKMGNIITESAPHLCARKFSRIEMGVEGFCLAGEAGANAASSEIT